MSIINYKLVVTGPFAAGKTTFISAVSEIPVVATEAGTTEGRDVKENTTVTLDFGKISVADEESLVELYLFGTPGQSRFDFMWEILSKGMIGYVLLVDASKPDTWEQAQSIKATFDELGDVPMVVAANYAVNADDIELLRAVLELDESVTIIPCDARSRASVKQVLLAILIEVLDRTEAAAEAGGRTS